jgi:hypothetical protein
MITFYDKQKRGLSLSGLKIPMISAVTNMAFKSLDADSLCGLSPFLFRRTFATAINK